MFCTCPAWLGKHLQVGGTGTASASRHIYRITARATGGSANTVRVMESTFAAKSN